MMDFGKILSSSKLVISAVLIFCISYLAGVEIVVLPFENDNIDSELFERVMENIVFDLNDLGYKTIKGDDICNTNGCAAAKAKEVGREYCIYGKMLKSSGQYLIAMYLVDSKANEVYVNSYDGDQESFANGDLSEQILRDFSKKFSASNLGNQSQKVPRIQKANKSQISQRLKINKMTPAATAAFNMVVPVKGSHAKADIQVGLSGEILVITESYNFGIYSAYIHSNRWERYIPYQARVYKRFENDKSYLGLGAGIAILNRAGYWDEDEDIWHETISEIVPSFSLTGGMYFVNNKPAAPFFQSEFSYNASSKPYFVFTVQLGFAIF